MSEKMVLTVNIQNLERYGDSGWQWSANGVTKRTNEKGHGLFHVRTDGQVNQTAGTMQFSLPKGKRAAQKELEKLYSVAEWKTY